MNAIFPGRFDPVHYGHVEIIKKALKDFDNIYVVIMVNPEKKETYTVEQRLKWLESIQSPNIIIDSHVGPATDYFEKAKTTTIIRGYRDQVDYDYEMVKEARYKKQNSDVNFVLIKGECDISSTAIRDDMEAGRDISILVPWK